MLISYVLLVLAFISFAAGSVNSVAALVPRLNLTALGLAFWALSRMIPA